MKQKIMIIEDNMITARQVSAFLNNDGYETKVYLDGESALADFQSYLPHLVLLDYFLPGMNAPDVCAGLRKLSLTPIIVLSANTRIQDKIQMLELGADDYVEKPFDQGELKARIHAVLRRYHPEMNYDAPDDAVGDMWNIRDFLSARPAILSVWTENLLPFRLKNWNFSIVWHLPPIGSLPENSFWIMSGATTIWVTPVP